MTTLDDLRRVVAEEQAYPLEAYLFLYNSLDRAQQELDRSGRHVTGKELLEGVRLLALEMFGPLTLMVFEHWRITGTDDFGAMVFHLVERQLMGKTDDDKAEDFQRVYDFQETFAFEKVLDERCPADLENPCSITVHRQVGTAQSRT